MDFNHTAGSYFILKPDSNAGIIQQQEDANNGNASPIKVYIYQ